MIRLSLSPTNELTIDDLVQVQAVLDGPGVEFTERFWVKVLAPEKAEVKPQRDEETGPDKIGLPEPVLVYREKRDKHLSWSDLESSGIEFDFSTIMHPYVEGIKLEKIYINMDSSVLKNYKGKQKTITDEQIETADKRYITSVYFHTLFLYTIARRKNYSVRTNEKEVEITEFLKDVFASYYSEFLLNFGIDQLMASLDI